MSLFELRAIIIGFLQFFNFSLTHSLIIDRNCTTMTSPPKFSPNSVNCENVYSDEACETIYSGSVFAGKSTERPYLCFMINGVRNDEIKKIAIATCPKTCGYCCQTDAFDCKNSKNPRINCDGVTVRQCRDPQWRNILTEDCPNICGFCKEGGCVDKAVDCQNDLSICLNIELQNFVKVYCKKTCGFCRPTPVPTINNSGQPNPDCLDFNTNCLSWSKNGLCENSFYSYEYKFLNCAATCQLC